MIRPVKRVLHFIICTMLILATNGNCSSSSEKQTNLTGLGPMQEFPGHPLIINDSNLDSALRQYSNFVLECWKYGCAPCVLTGWSIDDMASDLHGRVVFGKLCINENPVTVEKYDVSRGPTLLIFNRGTLIYKHIGNYPKATLEEMILSKLMLN
jgi:thioredoxin 1